MSRLSGLTVGQKVALAVAVLLMILVAGTAVTVSLSRQALAEVKQSTQSLEEVAAVSAAQQAWSQVAATLDYLLLTRQPSLVAQDLAEELEAFASAGEELQTVFGQGTVGEAQIAELAGFASELTALSIQVADQAEAEQWEPAQLLRYGQLASTEERFQQRLAVLGQDSGAAATAAVAGASQLQSRAQTATIALSALVLLLLVAGGALLTRSIVEPMRELATMAAQFAQGNFEARLPREGGGEVGRVAQALATAADALQEQYGGLEQRIAGRARALETTIEVGRQLAAIHDVDALVAAVVQQIQASFGYYHVHVYLMDQNRERLVMAGGTGEAGRTMLAQGHSLALGQGLVGLSARRNEPVLVPDTRYNSDWLPNPLLPDTSAEIAVPIGYGDEVLGVLDVQHDVPAGLGEDDLALLKAVAGQVAVALENARLLQEAGERSRQAALAYVIGQRIQRANSVEEVLRLAARELGQALGSERARVQLRTAPYVTTADRPAAAPQPAPREGGNT